MKKIEYLDVYDFVENILTINESDKKEMIIICNCNQIQDIIRSIILNDPDEEYIFVNIDFDMPEIDDYDKEYMVEIDNEKKIWISKAYTPKNQIYVMSMCDNLYYLTKFKKEIDDAIDYTNNYLVSLVSDIQDEDENKCDPDSELTYSYSNGKGFTISGIDENGNTYVKSFYSEDPQLTEFILNQWTT